MAKRFLEAGKIVNTHGVRGEVKIEPWADSPDFLVSFKRLYIEGKPVEVKSARTHKNCVIAEFDGVMDIDGAIKLKNKIVYIDREDVSLDEDRYFIADIIGLDADDASTGGKLGTVSDVLSPPANNVYVIKGEREILVPAVPDFVEEINIAEGFIKIRVIDGM